MPDASFDFRGRFLLADYAARRPFASFLPGIGGLWGIPLWVFYVNRGQCIASFGVLDKDHPILEFQPANKAYQFTPYTGFRTFLKVTRGAQTAFYEPFAPWSPLDASELEFGMKDVEIESGSWELGLCTNVLYFLVPDDEFGGLARQVTVTNCSDDACSLEMLDGLPGVAPYGMTNAALKDMSRTAEAWMEIYNLEQGMPFYRLRSSLADTAEVQRFAAGHFYLSFSPQADGRLPVLIDPALVFGADTSLFSPQGFCTRTFTELLRVPQVSMGRTPCAFGAAAFTLAPGESCQVFSITGHVTDARHLPAMQQHILAPGYLPGKLDAARQLAQRLTAPVKTQTASALFDAYLHQTFLDNGLRGGWPLVYGEAGQRRVYHVFSRKHGDLERDYNAFRLNTEPFSQGNGNYRDINQNRRCDVFFSPEIEDFEVLFFLNLLQLDGYNPLVIQGSRFQLSGEALAAVLEMVEPSDPLQPFFEKPFTPGELLLEVAARDISLKVSREDFIAAVLSRSEQRVEAVFGEGFWIDHWFYNLDMIDAYLSVYPDRKAALLFERQVTYFDSPAFVQPRQRKTVLVGDVVHQYGALLEDHEKAALLVARVEHPNHVRILSGQAQGEICRTTVFAKLVGLAAIKFATLDPYGMGIEMEAGKPGWYDALNGLPGLFGSSLGETYELLRLLDFLLSAAASLLPSSSSPLPELGEGAGGEGRPAEIDLLIEQKALIEALAQALQTWQQTGAAGRDFALWDACVAARERYRQAVRLGVDGRMAALPLPELAAHLQAFRDKTAWGLARAAQYGDPPGSPLPPTYFTYRVTDYARLQGEDGQPLCDAQGRPYVRALGFEAQAMPLFLEGPVHAMKTAPSQGSAQALYQALRASDLYDSALGMYKVNASLQDQPFEIGRARSFPPGWLENESIWTHMEYKYLLEVLRAGLHEEFFADFLKAGAPFLQPQQYGRSPLEHSSFIASSAFADPALHGTGFVARLSGATAEMLSLWWQMMTGGAPFTWQDGQLSLHLQPVLPGWLFPEDGCLSFTFLGKVQVTYVNPACRDTFGPGAPQVQQATLVDLVGQRTTLPGDTIPSPYAEAVRAGQYTEILLVFA